MLLANSLVAWLPRPACRGHGARVMPAAFRYPLKSTASMILGHWCPKYGPFDPRSWKRPLRPAPGSSEHHAALLVVRVGQEGVAGDAAGAGGRT